MISFSTSWKPALCVIWLQNMLLEIVFQQNTYSISNLKKIFFLQIMPIKLKKFKIDVSKMGPWPFNWKIVLRFQMYFEDWLDLGHCTYIMGHVCVRKNNSLFCIRLAIEVQKKKISLSFEHWPHVLAWRHKLPNFFFSQAKSLDFYTFFKLVY